MYRRLSFITVFSFFTLMFSLSSCSNNHLSKENLESEKTALTSLKKLNSDIELGLNVKEYSQLLKKVKFAVESVDSESESLKLMKKSLDGHILALSWWRCNLEGIDNDKDAKCRDALLPDIFNKFPLIEAKAKPLIQKSNRIYKSRAIDKNSILQLIWIESEKDTTKAEILILKQKT